VRRAEPIVLAGVLVALAALGCAPKRPVLYPNPHLREVGAEAANRDVDECLALAAAGGYEAKPGRTVAGSTAGGAAGGAAVGAAVGAVLGNAGKGAAAGAAGGATRGVLRGGRAARDPDPIQKRFVEECLVERGYKPIGWR
jgi:hypothetical protein